jgi:class 3 adenylate cyclase
VAACRACGVDLPADARFCPACGAEVRAPTPADERKLATVLFADLVGSTELGEQDPERTRALLDRFYDAMAAEIEGAGGTVEKFIGDAVMAAFGAPVALEDHAERALHAALAMQRRLRDLFGAELALRIGVNTGEVVVGRAREGSSFVTGDAVNVAQRLEAAADPGTILVGERTVAAVRGAFEFAPAEQIEAKGKREPVAGRRLLRALTLMRPRGVGELGQTFVGRDEEVRQLQDAYGRAVDRDEPELVTIVGDPGVGKTRLARELWQWLGTRSPEPLRRTGRCLSYGQGITYWPLAEVLREHFGLLDTDRPEVVMDKLAGREILGLTLGLDVAGDLHPLTVRDRLHDAWLELLEELAREQPLVVLIEDVHWAEDDLFDLLERILRDAGGPLLLLATARPELVDRRPGFGAGSPNATIVRLEPLSPADSARMLHDLLETELPAPVREVIVERAEGNPFFVEELISTLVDRELLQRADGRWTLQEVGAGFEVPDSVQAVLAARIDLLPPAEKAALQAASVIGRVFWAGPVYELVEGLEPDFRILEERDFVRRRSGSTMAGEREYAIKHALTREIAYAGLPKARRARLHAAFARWVEGVGRGRDEYAALLGHHYAEAVRPDDVDLAWAGDEAEVLRLRQQAVAWLRRAAELAVGRYELEDGVELLNRVLELETDAIGQAQLWREIGRAHVLRFDGEPFWAAMQQSLSVCPDRQTCADTYAELAHQTAIRAGMWRTRPAIELVDGWIERALELAEPDSRARAKALIARCFWHRDGVREAAEAATELAERLGEVELRRRTGPTSWRRSPPVSSTRRWPGPVASSSLHRRSRTRTCGPTSTSWPFPRVVQSAGSRRPGSSRT